MPKSPKPSYLKSLTSKQKLLFFTLSSINNTDYVIILSASDALSKYFKKPEYMPLFSAKMNIFGALIAIIYSLFLIKFSIRSKFKFCFLNHFFGILFILLSIFINNFFLCLFGAVLLGMGNSLGVSVIQTYLQEFHQNVHMAFPSGHAFSGVFGTLFYGFLKFLGVSDFFVILFLAGLLIVFYFCFEYLMTLKLREDIYLLRAQEKKDAVKSGDLVKNDNAMDFSFNDYKLIFNKIKSVSLTYGIVTLLRYGCITYLASSLATLIQRKGFSNSNYFPIFQIFYRFGYFGFSSCLIPCPLIKNGFIFLFINLFLYSNLFLFVIFGFANIYILCIYMLLLGINTGMSKINSTIILYNNKEITKKEKEVAFTMDNIIIITSIFLNGFKGTFINFFILKSF